MLLTAAEKRKDETINQLVDLWKTVFGDSEDYIKLLVPYLELFDCYVIKKETKIVSAFYLLPSEIKIGSRIYNGRYLYAAATFEECRRNGYMSQLINEAINDKKNQLDFISLVPANEGLYSYYGKFGFKPIMYNYESKIVCDGNNKTENDNITDGKMINILRKNKFDYVHLFTDETMNYALSCYSHFGSFFKCVNNTAILYIDDEKTVYEGLFSENETDIYKEYLKANYEDEITVVTSYKFNDSTEKNKCGMILDFSGELKNSVGIYMNHTLI